MRKLAYPLSIAFSLSLLVSCGTKTETAASGPQATVTLRDGTRYTGTVVSNTASELTIAGSDNTKHTFDTKNVKSVEYGETTTATLPPPPTPAAEATPPPPQANPQALANTPPPPAPATRAQTPPPPVQAPPPEPPHEQHYHPAEAAIRTRTFVVPSGAQVAVRSEETIDSARAAEGQTFAAELTRDVLDSEGQVILPRGSNAQIVIRSASKGGRFRGASDLVLDLDSVSVDGRRYRVETVDLVEKGKSGVGGNKRTAEYTGGGAAFGAIIGAIAGHGKGAAIGALSGAGAGALTQVLTKGGSIRVPAESVLTFRLERPLKIVRSE